MKTKHCILLMFYCITILAEDDMQLSPSCFGPPPQRVLLSEITNNCYITDDGLIGAYTGFVLAKHLEKATNTRECLPAKDFPEGNWGEPKHGYQLSLRFIKTTFTNGEPVMATILVRNLTNVWLDFHALEIQMGGPASFSVTNSRGETMQVTPYSPGILSSTSFSPPIAAHTQRKYEECLSNGFVLTNDTYRVQAYIDVPIEEAGSTNANGRPQKQKVTSASVAIKIGE
jgi:hypothetical protein